MKTNHLAKDLKEAITVFSRELPDPKVSDVSTIVDEFSVEGTDVLLQAQKVKGSNGMSWLIAPYNQVAYLE